MVAPHIQLALPPSPAEPSTTQKFPNIRRDRQTRDATTRQAQHVHKQLTSTSTSTKPYRYARAAAAVSPYAEFVH
jgi:hypothetical protein